MHMHEGKGWPKFYWDSEMLADVLADVCYRQGRLPAKAGFPMYLYRVRLAGVSSRLSCK